jgi:uncharacterized protein (TIGR02996 family)
VIRQNRGLASDPRNPQLEAAITGDPDDREAYLVYADWLEGQGDPRAQLIALQCSPHPEQHNGKAFRKLLADYREYFLGSLSRFASSLTWRYGFVQAVSLNDAAGPCPANVENLLRHPSARFLVELSIWSRYLDDVIPLVATAPATLRTLSLENTNDRELSLEGLQPVLHGLSTLSLYGPLGLDIIGRASLAGLRKLTISGSCDRELRLALPGLVTLSLRGRIAVEAIELPMLDEAILHLEDPSSASAHALATASWPRLRRLVLGTGSAPDLAPLFQRDDLRSLTELALPHASADELCQRLGDAPFAGQLRVLDLSNSGLTDAGVDALAIAADTFSSLESLDVSRTRLGEAGYEVLDQMEVPEILDDRRFRDAGE